MGGACAPQSPPSPSCSWSAAAALRTACFSVLIFGPVLCGIMMEDIQHFIRDWIHGTNSTSASSEEDDGLLVAKLTAMAVLGGASLTLGLLPLKLASCLGWGRHSHRKRGDAAAAIHNHGGSASGGVMLSALLCFGGGVLLCTTFIHMLPEVQENFEELEKDGVVTGSLVHTAPHLLMCAGFFIMYLVEELVHAYLHWRNHKHRGEGEQSNLARHPITPNDLMDPEDAKKSPLKSLKWGVRDSKPSTVVLEYADGSQVNSEVPPDFRVSVVTFSNPWGVSLVGEKQYLKVDTERPCCQGVPKVVKVSAKCHKVHHEHLEPDYSETMPDFMAGANHHSHAIPASGAGSCGAAEDDAEPEDSVVTALRGLLIVLALCVHELFEGLAVGLESSATYVWYMLMAVACHKLVIAFCIGVELVAMRTKMFLHVVYVSTFAIVSPLGIGVGILVTAKFGGLEGGVVPAVLQGLATGTLLYVVFFEILERQRACGHSSIRQFLAVLLGFLVMYGLMQIGGHHHHDHEEASHSHSHDAQEEHHHY